MTQEQHPITPPPELVEKWYKSIPNSSTSWKQELATQAARWGADQRLEAVKHWLITGPYGASIATGSPTFVADLCDAFKPKPPSLKERALCHLESFAGSIETLGMDSDLIRRALEVLPD